MEFGKQLDSSTVETGLRELNNDISFDAPLNRPSDYHFPFSHAADYIAKYMGVYYNGKHVCAMDRGVMPEVKVWSVREDFQPIDMVDIEKFENTRVIWVVVPEHHKNYHEALSRAEGGDDNYQFDENGRVIRMQALLWGKVKDRVIQIGWRHTFEALLREKIPGVTRDTLGEKFGINMYKFPVGTEDEVQEALFQE